MASIRYWDFEDKAGPEKKSKDPLTIFKGYLSWKKAELDKKNRLQIENGKRDDESEEAVMVNINDKSVEYSVASSFVEKKSNLSREESFELLKDILTLGEDAEFSRAVAVHERVSREDAEEGSWESRLRLGMCRHQIALHFRGPIADSYAEPALYALFSLEGHPLGPYCQQLITAATLSVQCRSDSSLRGRLKEDSSCFLGPYCAAVYTWRETGSVESFVLLGLRCIGTKERAPEPNYMPTGLLSWSFYRVAVHNVSVAKRLKTKKQKKMASQVSHRGFLKAVELDTEKTGASNAAKQEIKIMEAAGLIFE